MKLMLRLIVIGVIVGLHSGCVTYQPGAEATSISRADYQVAQVIENITYTTSGWVEPLEADLYLPEREGALPVVLMIHGGGWAARNREDMNGISRKLAQHGYAVFNINYRFAPTYTFPAQLLDVQQAVKWLSENAYQYDFDITRISAWGYSSGAHLAALAGSYNFSEQALITGDLDLPRIRTVVAGGIPADLRQYCSSPVVMRFLGGGCDDRSDLYAQASPVTHVSPDDPPVFLYHGKLDLLVNREQATEYYETLVGNGVEAELYLHGGRGHATMFLFGSDAEDKAIAFLNRTACEGELGTPRC